MTSNMKFVFEDGMLTDFEVSNLDTFDIYITCYSVTNNCINHCFR